MAGKNAAEGQVGEKRPNGWKGLNGREGKMETVATSLKSGIGHALADAALLEEIVFQVPLLQHWSASAPSPLHIPAAMLPPMMFCFPERAAIKAPRKIDCCIINHLGLLIREQPAISGVGINFCYPFPSLQSFPSFLSFLSSTLSTDVRNQQPFDNARSGRKQFRTEP